MAKNLLVGNGLSISISSDFSYQSLREKIDGNSSPAVDRLFKTLNTVDFEQLLRKVKDARDVLEAITDGQVIVSKSISDEIREKFIEAIRAMNPSDPREHSLDVQRLNSALSSYNNIFTTNYDIYLYWARKGQDQFNIIDFFFNCQFDRNKANAQGASAIYFLHGALFIFEDGGSIYKLNKGRHSTLFDAIEHKINVENTYPLFISEGTSGEKLANIKGNQYLSFCYDSFRALNGELDIYGHSLSTDVDAHIVSAVKEANIEHITYYQYEYIEMSEPQQTELQISLNKKLGSEVLIKDSKEHDLSKWSIWEGFSFEEQ